MIDPTNRAFQEQFYNRLLKVDRPTGLKLLEWFANAAHGAGCLTGGLHMVEANEPEVDLGELEANILHVNKGG